MPAASTRTLRASSGNKKTGASIIGVESLPSEAPMDSPGLDEAILREVLNQFDSSEIIGALARKVAPRLAASVKLDELAGQILETRQEKLSARLTELILEQLSG